MEQCFIPTQNFRRTQELISDLLRAPYGVELAAITGRAGRGKTTAAQRIFSENSGVVYVLYQEGWSINDTLREIAFGLSGMRPFRRQKSMELIQSELGRDRRAVLVDEADRAPIRVLNALRNVHDICAAPIVLIGEDDLTRKLSQERRLASRIRRHIAYEAQSQTDVVMFYKLAMGLKLSTESAARLLNHSKGDFRVILTDALAVERLMVVNSLPEITNEIIQEVTNGDGETK